MYIRRNQIIKTKLEIEKMLAYSKEIFDTKIMDKYNSFGDYNHSIIDTLEIALSNSNTIIYDDCCGTCDPDDVNNLAYTDVSNCLDWLIGKNENFNPN